MRRIPLSPTAVTALVLTLASTAAVHSTPPATIDSLAFMTGAWSADFNGSRLEEHFTAPRDGSMVGMFRWTSDGRTRITEHLVIEQHDDGVRFHLRHFNPGSVVWEKEADGPMTFSLIEVGEGRAVFGDDARDFPRRVVYHRTRPDTMILRLEGRRDSGEARTVEFTFRSISMTTQTETLTEAGQSIGYEGGLTIAFNVKDVKKSIDWYQEVLGFKLTYHLEEMGWCELSTSVDKVNVGLSQVEEPKIGGPTQTFGVRDIDHSRKVLEERGVRFDGETIEIPEMVKLATFYDPDGNSLMLFQLLSG